MLTARPAIVEGGWLRLHRPLPRGADGDAARGPWKPDRTGARLVFDAPLDAIAARIESLEGAAEPDAIAQALVEWAEATHGGPDPSWSPPDAAPLQRALPDAALTYRTGSLIERARLDAGTGVLALRVALARIQGALTDARQAWLDRYLIDAGSLRMVRVERRSGAIEATVDLAGAPPRLVPDLLAVSLDVLRHAFTILAPTAAVIADAQWRSEVLDDGRGMVPVPHCSGQEGDGPHSRGREWGQSPYGRGESPERRHS
jgi:hypothetical protein